MSNLNQLYSNYFDSVDCLIIKQSSNWASLCEVAESNCLNNVEKPVYLARFHADFFGFQDDL